MSKHFRLNNSSNGWPWWCQWGLSCVFSRRKLVQDGLFLFVQIFEIDFEVGHSSIIRSEPTTEHNPPRTHDWKLFLRSADIHANLNCLIHRCVFNLHPDFADCKRGRTISLSTSFNANDDFRIENNTICYQRNRLCWFSYSRNKNKDFDSCWNWVLCFSQLIFIFIRRKNNENFVLNTILIYIQISMVNLIDEKKVFSNDIVVLFTIPIQISARGFSLLEG